jgi:hypothetical protein
MVCLGQWANMYIVSLQTVFVNYIGVGFDRDLSVAVKSPLLISSIVSNLSTESGWLGRDKEVDQPGMLKSA